MNLERRHRALRAWRAADFLRLPIAEVLAWPDVAISVALLLCMQRGA